MDDTFEGAIINGKRFPFVRITMAEQPKIQRKLNRLKLYDFFVAWFYLRRIQKIILRFKKYGIPAKDVMDQTEDPNSFIMTLARRSFIGGLQARRTETEPTRQWKKVRDAAFEKRGLWKFGIVPKELWCSQIKFQDAGGIQADFFALWRAAGKEYSEHLDSLKDSKTKEKTAASVAG